MTDLPKVRATVFLAEALKLMGTPYIWGGKGLTGIDCSGAVTYAYWRAGGPDLRAMHGSARLWEMLPEPDLAQPLRVGHLVFYGPSHRISHVMIHVACGIVVGACGGDRSTTSLARAAEQKARVDVKTTYHYRRDLRGFRMLPLIYLTQADGEGDA